MRKRLCRKPSIAVYSNAAVLETLLRRIWPLCVVSLLPRKDVTMHGDRTTIGLQLNPQAAQWHQLFGHVTYKYSVHNATMQCLHIGNHSKAVLHPGLAQAIWWKFILLNLLFFGRICASKFWSSHAILGKLFAIFFYIRKLQEKLMNFLDAKMDAIQCHGSKSRHIW